ncbi:MAG: signal peptidase I [Flavobacterium sp.]
MTLTQWFIFFLAVQVIHFLGTWKLYHKAGRKPWEAAIPVYNAVVLMRIIGRPAWWTVLLFIPIVNLIMFPVVWVETLRSFGKTSTTDTILGVVTLGLYIYYINYFEDVQYRPERELKASTKGGDTLSSLLFAVVVATIVHTYIMQPFNIPSSSLEKTLLVGDFLFVSKVHYGPRTPMTTVALPMVHDAVPIINKKSYSDWPQLPYFRIPGFEKIEKNDIVVFNGPADTIIDPNSAIGIRKPIDKRINLVKRCVATPGDTFEMRDGFVYIDGKELKLSDRAKPQFTHFIYTKNGISPTVVLQAGSTEFIRSFVVSNLNQDQYNALAQSFAARPTPNADGSITVRTNQLGLPAQTLRDYQISAQEVIEPVMQATLTLDAAEKLRGVAEIDSVIRFVEKGEQIVYGGKKGWNADNMGPIFVPGEGKTVKLTLDNIAFYKRPIAEYENNTLKVENGQIIINGKATDSYTFKQDYYIMMGDNRHNSLDGRVWGFAPFNHVVGKPVFIWMSLDENVSWFQIHKKIRWDRLFTTVGGDGEPVSYFWYFVGALAIYVGYSQFKKRKAVKA